VISHRTLPIRGKNNVIRIITAVRELDQVVLVTTYFENDDFRVCLHAMTIDDIRIYMRQLLEALAHVHEYVSSKCGLWHINTLI
jgi:serine/threonine protein kinase